MDPQVRAFLEQVAAENPPGWPQLGVAEARRLFTSFGHMFGDAVEVTACTDDVFSEVPVRIYTPSGTPPFPGLTYFHGGGWVLGDLDTHDALCRRLCRRSGAAVMAVDYRRAPEHKFPTAADDCYRATAYWSANAAAFGIDAERLIVAGDSAGGNLATAVAIRARDEGHFAVHRQVLLYPVIEPDFNTDSYRSFATGYGLTREAMQWFWDCYLAEAHDRQSPLAVPTAADLKELPPALIVTAEYDVLRDEGREFATRLQAAGVPATYWNEEGVIHGFIHMHGIFDRGKQAIEKIALWIRNEVNAAS